MTLIAAMVRFPTVPREHWEAVVAGLRDLGFDSVDIPLVWREHEVEPGRFEFERGDRSLRDMLEIVHGAGLSSVVRLGPMCSDDAPGLCLPERIVRDGRIHARTRRQNPVLVPDPPRMVPLPSVACEAFRAEAVAWVAAASRAVRELQPTADSVVRFIIGDGPHTLLRDDPFDYDHHPEARGLDVAIDPPHDGDLRAALAHIERQTAHAASYREALVASAVSAGVAPERIVVAVHGSADVSPLAYRLAVAHPLALPSPPPVAGSTSLWRQVRRAAAITHAHGAHFDFWSGGPAWYPPMRGSHTLAAARVAFAAGVRDCTVRMGCAGQRWVGAVISETAQRRPHAAAWRDLIAWARTLPRGREQCVELVEPVHHIEAARAATAVHPLPAGLLGLLGLTPSELAVPGAHEPGCETMGEFEARLREAERTLLRAGLPFRRTPGPNGPAAKAHRFDMPTLLARGEREFKSFRITSEPEGSVMVRAVVSESFEHLILVSRSEQSANVRLQGRGWQAGDQAVGTVGVAIDPGDVVHVRRPARRRATTVRKTRAR